MKTIIYLTLCSKYKLKHTVDNKIKLLISLCRLNANSRIRQYKWLKNYVTATNLNFFFIGIDKIIVTKFTCVESYEFKILKRN